MSFRIIAIALFGLLIPASWAAAQTDHDQRGIVAALSGEEDIAPGVRLVDRQSVTARRQVRDFLGILIGELGLTAQTHAYRQDAANIYATLPATTASAATVVIGAHYDSVRRSPGANDNATGVALIHAVAAAMVQAPCRTKRLTVVYFDEEEVGLVGSRNFAALLRSQNAVVHSVHTADQMGWDGDGDRAVEIELPTAALRTLYLRVAQQEGLQAHITSTSSTDHDSFRSAGFESVGLTEEYVNGDTTPHYHRSTDTLDTVDFDYLASSTGYMTAVISSLLTAGCPAWQTPAAP